MKDLFSRIASRSAFWMGHYWAFTLAVLACVVWAASGPFFGFSDTWQLVINTGTTVLTFLMVFLIQNTQNRESKAIQLKLDELVRAVETASDRLIDVEETTDDELDALKQQYRDIAENNHVHDEQDRFTAEGVRGGVNAVAR
jgi:low affinity Fe/Cu permease